MAVLDSAVTERGEKLAALTEASPVLLVFLRHAGCTFCREALGDIARERAAIETSGVRIILVHMGDSKALDKLIGKYGLAGVDRICDGEQRLYDAFGLKRGGLGQLFGPKVLFRGIKAAIMGRHGIGRVSADSFQLPGVFLLGNSNVLRRFRHRSAADRPDYLGLCAMAGECRGPQ